MVLTLSSAFASEDPDATVTYLAGSNDLTDVAANELASGASPNITDGIAPTFTAETTSLTTIEVTFSENVDSTSDAKGQWAVAGPLTIDSVDTLNGAGNTMTITLNAGTPLANTGATPNVTYTAGDIVDGSANAMVTATDNNVSDGVPPEIEKAETGDGASAKKHNQSYNDRRR